MNYWLIFFFHTHIKGTSIPYVSAKQSHLLLYLTTGLIEFYQLRSWEINIEHVLLHLKPMLGQPATCLRQYIMFQVNLIFSNFLLIELDQLYDLWVMKTEKKKKDFTEN